MSGTFCKWSTQGSRTECHRCGSICYDGNEPTCPPWVTRSEPDGLRLPHIKNIEQNKALFASWVKEENYKLTKKQFAKDAGV